MTKSFHDVDLDLSRNALAEEDLEEALEEGLDEDELEEYEADEESVLSESELANILSGDEETGLDDDWGVDELGEF